MNSGYEQHFKKLKNKSSKKKAGLPVFSLLTALLGAGLASYGYTHIDKMEGWMSALEITLFEPAKAAESKEAPAANVAGPTKEAGPKECAEVKGFSQEELSHFNKLNDRKRELDLREAELNQLEEELHKQKKEIEDRIVKLEQIRSEVANVLKERVEIDQQRVSTLVDFYSNMKPKQAADIFTKLNENLAVEVLSKMKKKNAADILNLIEPGKARALSEKFTGYQRQ